MDAGPLQPFIDAFVVGLRARRHTALTVSNYENSARHFAGWLCCSKVQLGQVDEDVIQRFAKHRCRCPGARRQKSVSSKYVRRVRRFIWFLADHNVLATMSPGDAKTIDPRVAAYQDWLRHHRGISERTVDRHGRMITRLLPGLGAEAKVYDAALIRRVIIDEAKRSSRPHVKTMTTALRGYLRFLAAVGFRILVGFAARRLGVRPYRLEVEQLDAPLILAFLEHIEADRGNSARTRNARLAAINAFFRFLEYRLPSCLDQASRIRAIPMKKTDEALVEYLSRNELQALLDAPDSRIPSGIRDRAMLHLAFAAGLRVSELVGLQLDQLDRPTLSSIHVLGKGRRERVLPLWKETTTALKIWLARRPPSGDPALFLNAVGRAMTRSGFEYILAKHAATAARTQPSIGNKRVTPHVLRHTCAMHTLQATRDVRKVSLWLGHASLQSTEIYLRADPTGKLEALAATSAPMFKPGRFHAPDRLLSMLKRVGRSDNYVE